MNTEQLDYYQQKLAYEIDSWELNAYLENNDAIAIIDGRSLDAYEIEHIPGAISLCHNNVNLRSIENLDNNKTYICYGYGIGCNASIKTAMKLLTLGFQVKELNGGLKGWKHQGYPTHGKEAPQEVLDEVAA